MKILIEQQILGFQVPVNDSLPVNVFQNVNDFGSVEFS